LTERLPRDLKKRFARDGISFFEIGDIGENDTHRIATFDVSGLLVPMRNRESEENAITGGKGLSLAQREDRAKASTSLNFPDPLFVRRVYIHQEVHREIDFEVDRRHRRGCERTRMAPDASGPIAPDCIGLGGIWDR
jgi:hypothetical protein